MTYSHLRAAYTPGSDLGPMLGNEYGKPLPLPFTCRIQRKLRVNKQQQLEGMYVQLEAANSKGNSRQFFQIVKSNQWLESSSHVCKCIQSATGKNVNKAAQITDRWKGYCIIVKNCTIMKKEKIIELNKNIGSNSLHHFVQKWLFKKSFDSIPHDEL